MRDEYRQSPRHPCALKSEIVALTVHARRVAQLDRRLRTLTIDARRRTVKQVRVIRSRSIPEMQPA
jgi:hypothetical protein